MIIGEANSKRKWLVAEEKVAVGCVKINFPSGSSFGGPSYKTLPRGNIACRLVKVKLIWREFEPDSSFGFCVLRTLCFLLNSQIQFFFSCNQKFRRLFYPTVSYHGWVCRPSRKLKFRIHVSLWFTFLEPEFKRRLPNLNTSHSTPDLKLYLWQILKQVNNFATSIPPSHVTRVRWDVNGLGHDLEVMPSVWERVFLIWDQIKSLNS